MLRSKIIPITAVAVLAAGSAGAALADTGEDCEQKEIAAVLNAKTSLAQAIAAAEQETGGTAIDTSLENQDGAVAYQVEVAKGNTVQKVIVSLDTGKIIKVMSTNTEQSEEEDENEGEDEND